MMGTPDWDGLFKTLEAWRRLEAEAGSVPSVTEVAEYSKRDPWAVLASTILSLRTKDAVTSVASRALLSEAPDPAVLLTLTEQEIGRLIYPAGFYKTKAANLKKIAALLTEQYGGKVPPDMDRLLALPGVGRKTANLVLTEAFDMYGICVDVHVHRICNRLGALETKTPEETETRLRNILPRKYWKGINSLFVLYGQQICRPVSPFCSRCVIAACCEKRGVERTR
jgi:endonuclease-3